MLLWVGLQADAVNRELLDVIREVKAKMDGNAPADTLLAILSAAIPKGERMKAIVAAHMDAAGVKCLR